MNLTLESLHTKSPRLSLPVELVEHADLPGIGTVGFRRNQCRAGRALIFLHGVKVTSGPHELQPLRAAFPDRPTYALDWPGYGASSLPARGGSGHHCARALLAFIEQAIPPEQQAVDVIAVSRGCEFAARAALREPRLLRSLAFLSPTGLGGARRSPKLAQLVRELRRSPALSALVFRALTSTPALLYSLLKSLDGRAALSLAVEAHREARQPGACLAPLTFLEESLLAQFASTSLYQALRLPTFVLYGRDPDSNFELLPALTRDNPFVRSLRVQSQHGAPHLESLPGVESALREYYRAIDVAERLEDWECIVETVPSPLSDFRAA